MLNPYEPLRRMGWHKSRVFFWFCHLSSATLVYRTNLCKQDEFFVVR